MAKKKQTKETPERTKIQELEFDNKNFNKGTAYGKQLLEKSIGKFGAGRSILLDKNNRIIAGNKTTEEWGELGMEDIMIVETDGKTLVAVKRNDIDLDTPEGREFALADNATARASIDWDLEGMQDELSMATIEEWGVEVPGENQKIDEDEAPPLAKEIRTQPGDLYQLTSKNQEHRLLCGDSTKAEDVNTLMAGMKAGLIFTDPPYGVSYTGVKTKDQDQKWEMIDNDDLRDAGLFDFLHAAFENMYNHQEENTSAYIWHATKNHIEFETALNAAGFQVKQQLIWNKGMTLGRADYHWSHEPVLYCKRTGETTPWYGDRTHKTVLQTKRSEFAAMKKDQLIRLLNMLQEDSTNWELDREKVTQYQHPTQKPVSLATRAILNSSKPGDIVLDLFAGSGSTLVAAHIMDRQGYAMEQDPQYADVIIKRMAAMDPSLTIKRNGIDETQEWASTLNQTSDE